MADIRITQRRSTIGSTARQRRTLESLGLRKPRQSVTMPDRPEVRGMVSKVAHLVDVQYPGDEVLDLEAGQRPKGEGNPPAGPEVADNEAAAVAEAREEALSQPGSAELGDLVDQPARLSTTDGPNKPKPRGSSVDTPDENPEPGVGLPLGADEEQP